VATVTVESLVNPATPGYTIYEQIARFLSTGSLTPTFSTAPVYRASTAVTAQQNTTTLTFNHTLSANIVAGDFIILAAIQGINVTAPSGWSYITCSATGVYGQVTIFYKFAVAGDIGAVVTLTSTNSTIWATVSAAYSGVWTACPFNSGGQAFVWANGEASVASATLAAFTTTAANTLVLSFWGGGLAATTPTFTVPGTVRGTSQSGGSGEVSLVMTEQAGPATAGVFAAQTATTSASILWIATLLVLQGPPTVVTAPAGGWTFVDQYGTFTLGTGFWVWKSTVASPNNAGVDWYLIIKASPPGFNGTAVAMAVYVCETYSTSTRIWNACAMNTGSTALVNLYSTAGTSPPWALVQVTTSTVGTTYTSQYFPAFSAPTTNVQLMITANADGFFLAVASQGTQVCCIYAGAFQTLLYNPQLTDGGVVLCDLSVVALAGSSTRDPGPTNMGYWGTYHSGVFWPGGLTFQGNVNGATTNTDIYQAPAGTVIMSRVLLYKITTNSAVGNGIIRCLLPQWIQSAPQTGLVWGSKVTEGSDTLQYVIGNAASLPIFVDTAA
jgi:hypothetical protein